MHAYFIAVKEYYFCYSFVKVKNIQNMNLHIRFTPSLNISKLTKKLHGS